MYKLTTRMIATGLGTGYSPWVPGTVGTLPAWIIAFFVTRGDIALTVAATVAFTAISVWSSSAAEAEFGHDSKKIVIDEWAGMFVSLVLVPYSLKAYLIALVCFRVFDVIKLPPAAQAERLPSGWGVTGDDVVAGIQANLVTHLILWVWL